MLVFDKAFLNGKIYTMDENQTCAEAMLVHGGKIPGSYTHLDVYKRQPVYPAGGLSTPLAALTKSPCFKNSGGRV